MLTAICVPFVYSFSGANYIKRLLTRFSLDAVPLNCPEVPAEVYLTLENLQPIGSFKIRDLALPVSRRWFFSKLHNFLTLPTSTSHLR
jgi:hypothetical protein